MAKYKHNNIKTFLKNCLVVFAILVLIRAAYFNILTETIKEVFYEFPVTVYFNLLTFNYVSNE